MMIKVGDLVTHNPAGTENFGGFTIKEPHRFDIGLVTDVVKSTTSGNLDFIRVLPCNEVRELWFASDELKIIKKQEKCERGTHLLYNINDGGERAPSKEKNT